MQVALLRPVEGEALAREGDGVGDVFFLPLELIGDDLDSLDDGWIEAVEQERAEGEEADARQREPEPAHEHIDEHEAGAGEGDDEEDLVGEQLGVHVGVAGAEGGAARGVEQEVGIETIAQGFEDED